MRQIDEDVKIFSNLYIFYVDVINQYKLEKQYFENIEKSIANIKKYKSIKNKSQSSYDYFIDAKKTYCKIEQNLNQCKKDLIIYKKCYIFDINKFYNYARENTDQEKASGKSYVSTLDNHLNNYLSFFSLYYNQLRENIDLAIKLTNDFNNELTEEMQKRDINQNKFLDVYKRRKLESKYSDLHR